MLLAGTTLENEGFERFTRVSTRQGQALLEYAISGRFAYIHILANEQIPFKKVKKAITKTFDLMSEMEGLILDLRYNEVNEASQAAWLDFIVEAKETLPGTLLSGRPIDLPKDWSMYLPWQYFPDNEEDNNVHARFYSKNQENSDLIILSALRKLRLPDPLKDFGRIW